MFFVAFVWMMIGFGSTVAAILKFRPNGTNQMSELILAAGGPFFGPIVLILLLMDLYRMQDQPTQVYEDHQ